MTEETSNVAARSVLGRLSPDMQIAFSGEPGGGSLTITGNVADQDQMDALLTVLRVMYGWMTPVRDSDRSGEAGETPQSGSTVGESAGLKGIAQPAASPTPDSHSQDHP